MTYNTPIAVTAEIAPIGGVTADAPQSPRARRTVDTWARPRLGWYGVGMVALVTVFGQLDRGVMAILVQSIKRDTGFTDTQLSLLMGLAYSLTFMAAGLPMARLSDVGRRSWILPGALVVWSAGTALCGVAQSFWSFFLYRGLVGAGEAVKGPASASLIPDFVARDKLPRAFGLYNLAISVGEALALILGGLLLGWLVLQDPIVVPGVGELYGWRLVYLIFGLPGILLAIWFVMTVPEPVRHGRKRPGSAPVREVAAWLLTGPASRVYVPLFLSAAASSLFTMGNLAWRPTFYERTFGLGPAEYGPMVGLTSIVAAPLGVLIGTVLVERMVRRWDDAHLRIAFYTDIVAIPVAIASPLMPRFELALCCQFVASVLLMMSAPSRSAALQIVTPNEMRAQTNAIFMFTIGVVGSGLGPLTIAALTDFVFGDEAHLRFAIATAASVAVPLTTLCIWCAMKPYGRLYRAAIDAEPHN